ncbi:cell surface protein [Polaribacter sp. SA4-10]|uniref:tetratricopeptide repeat protein n=1 Tax=Polaribacter sp. SA4-10 TaxID=754397 RepID=UPI000B3C1185|nr:tetratricopeptide repeat protein [Polaribacter sp. SA4-10]ARV06005.1 cell surface protein [Polaribacter sp. SA4-10]
MKYRTQIFFLISFVFLVSCSPSLEKNKITSTKDYEGYLKSSENNQLKTVQADFNFWESKLKETPNQYPYNVKLASNYNTLFKITGKIDFLKKAEKNLIVANEKINYTNSGYLRSLARNYISQHRFKESLALLLKAEKLGQNLKGTQKMLIDVYLELGNYAKVESYLTEIRDINDFDYLIRISKYNDHLGNLEDAINYLEKSLAIAKSKKNASLLKWNYTNLADYYGHAGRIKDSYNAYLKALEIDSNDAYAKKGIAWIVYSYERNPEEALRILDEVSKKNASPDYYLLKAEIAEFMNDEEKKETNLALYFSAIDTEMYGDMYNKYNSILLADDFKTIDKALEIAKIEVKNRPTAQSYDLLAWSYYKKGDYKKALEITENHVIGHTFEPQALLHAAHILKVNGKDSETIKLKEELLGSIYELGPLTEKEIQNI